MNTLAKQIVKPADGWRLPASAPIRIGLWMVSGLFIVFFAIRLYFALKLLPSPVGDSVEELEPIFNYCHNNALLAHLWPLDPAKLDRFDWHGPLPAMMFHWLSPGCTLRWIYIVHTIAFLTIPAALLFLVWRQMLPPTMGLAVCLFAFAAYEKLQFRPESFALIFVVLTYCAYRLRSNFIEGFLVGCLIATAPVSGAFYGLVRLVLGERPRPLDAVLLTTGALAALLAFVLLYPFPIKDLMAGLAANAHVTVNRSDGSLISGLFFYYIRSDFLPLWGISLILLIISLLRATPAIALVLPFIWFFGFRAPPTNYNLVPLTVAMALLGYPGISVRWRPIVVLSLVVPAILGLSQLTLRDAISAAAYPESYTRTQALMDKLLADRWPIIRSPPFTIFMSPELIHVASNSIPALTGGHLRGAIIIVADNAYRRECPAGSDPIDKDRTRIRFFNSSSSWAVGICKVN